MSKCNRCGQEILKGEKYHVTKRGRHHYKCGICAPSLSAPARCMTVGDLKQVLKECDDKMPVCAARGHLDLYEVKGISVTTAYADHDLVGARPIKVLRLEAK